MISMSFASLIFMIYRTLRRMSLLVIRGALYHNFLSIAFRFLLKEREGAYLMEMSQEKQKRRVALAGATGLVGSYCLRLLLDSPSIQEVIVLTRRPLKLSDPK